MCKGQELAAPLGGGAAEGAEAAFSDSAVGGGGVLCGVESLAAGFLSESAGFQQMDFDTEFRKTGCEREASNARTDDADGGLEDLRLGLV